MVFHASEDEKVSANFASPTQGIGLSHLLCRFYFHGMYLAQQCGKMAIVLMPSMHTYMCICLAVDLNSLACLEHECVTLLLLALFCQTCVMTMYMIAFIDCMCNQYVNNNTVVLR